MFYNFRNVNLLPCLCARVCVCVSAFNLLLISFLGYPNIVATYGRGYTGFAPSYSYQFPGESKA